MNSKKKLSWDEIIEGKVNTVADVNIDYVKLVEQLNQLSKHSKEPVPWNKVFYRWRSNYLLKGNRHEFFCIELAKRRIFNKDLYEYLFNFADINHTDKDRQSVLSVACASGGDSQIEFIRYLLDKGADPNVENMSEALGVVSEKGSMALIKLLVERGAQVNLRDSRCLTPLMRTVIGTDFDAFKYLFYQLKADPWIIDHDGKTAMEMATFSERLKRLHPDALTNAYRMINMLMLSKHIHDYAEMSNRLMKAKIGDFFGFALVYPNQLVVPSKAELLKVVVTKEIQHLSENDIIVPGLGIELKDMKRIWKGEENFYVVETEKRVFEFKSNMSDYSLFLTQASLIVTFTYQFGKLVSYEIDTDSVYGKTRKFHNEEFIAIVEIYSKDGIDAAIKEFYTPNHMDLEGDLFTKLSLYGNLTRE